MKHLRSRFLLVAALATIIFGLFTNSASHSPITHAQAAKSAAPHAHINCATGSRLCTEVYDSEKVFGKDVYIGHDEPSMLFYSNQPGAGNRARYHLTLPRDPSPSNPMQPGKSYNFELHPAFWFGMALCNTQSWPEQLSTCTPDSDSNIVDPAISPKHAGTAFLELQFYPPGWSPWPAGVSCDARQWCVAMVIWSLAQNPVTGQSLNSTCASKVGVEYGNFAFLTYSGVPHAPANPIDANASTFTPNPKTDLFMNSGDQLVVTMNDSQNGLQIGIQDQTGGQSGSMTASAKNTFGMVKFDPNGTSCVNIPYDFHPMYSTSSEKTRVTWAAHSYNVGFSDEIGHFDYCSKVDPSSGACTANEGMKVDTEPTDSDDSGCFPSSVSLLVKVSGCISTNTGFDGAPYQPLWPDGNTNLHPTSILYSSPLTGFNFQVNYTRMAFEADLPRIESTCDRNTGSGCTLIPTTDDTQSAVFYPFFSDRKVGNHCVWQLGNHIPGSTKDFGQNSQYGTLLTLTYTGMGGAPVTLIEDFRQVFAQNGCPATP